MPCAFDSSCVFLSEQMRSASSVANRIEPVANLVESLKSRFGLRAYYLHYYVQRASARRDNLAKCPGAGIENLAKYTGAGLEKHEHKKQDMYKTDEFKRLC